MILEMLSDMSSYLERLLRVGEPEEVKHLVSI